MKAHYALFLLLDALLECFFHTNTAVEFHRSCALMLYIQGLLTLFKVFLLLFFVERVQTRHSTNRADFAMNKRAAEAVPAEAYNQCVGTLTVWAYHALKVYIANVFGLAPPI
jgi:hypothetical protein